MDNTFVMIETQRLILRKLEKEDAADFYAYRSDSAIQEYQFFQPKSTEETLAFLAGTADFVNLINTWFQLAVCLKDTNELIGDIGMHFTQDVLQSEIGYTIAPQYQRQGYAEEGVQAVMAYLFQDLGKHRIFASVDPLNLPSVRLLEKLKLRKEAHFIKSYRLADGWGDDAIYAMLEEEWFSMQIKNSKIQGGSVNES